MADYITLTEATKIIPGRPATPTVWRWTKYGVRRIKLRSIRTGNKVLTTVPWVKEFIDACNQSDAERAEAELIFDGC